MAVVGTQSWHERLWRIWEAARDVRDDSFRVSISGRANLDAFGRFKVATPATLFDSQMQYDTQPLLWAEKLVGGGAVTHRPVESSADLTVGTASGDRVVRQTREYQRYQPGKAQSILCTGVLGASQAGTTKLVGYGDDNNGVFFGSDGGGVFVLLRSNTTGTPSDARKVYQADWNVDRLDGSGVSGITLDPDATQIYLIDIEWLGVGSVRTGFIIDGSFYFAHIFDNANVRPTTYMTTANLPARYEIRNDAAVAAPATLKQICTSIVSEGGVDRTAAYPFSAVVTDFTVPNGAGNKALVFAARQKLLFNGIENRAQWQPLQYEVLPVGGRVVSEIVYDPVITGGTWVDIDGGSSTIEGNFTIASFTGGTAISASIAAGGGAKSSTPVFGRTATDRLPFGLDVDGANPIPLALSVYALENNVTASFTFQWEEIR